MEKRIKTESLLEATVRVSNADDSGRRYDMGADVRVSAGRVTSINNGTLKPTDEADGHLDGATFSSWEGGRTSVEFPQGSSTEEKTAMLEAVEEFIEECRTWGGSLV